jgi:ribonuclease P protein component
MFVLPNQQRPFPRVGFSISHRVGNAVRRNRIKRRLRSCFDQVLPHLDPGWDILVVARQALEGCEVSFSEFQSAVNELLGLAGLLNNDEY